MEGGNIEMANNASSVIFFIGAVHQLRRRLKEKMNQDVEVRKRYAEVEAKLKRLM
ncbi:hypothetical protein KAX97_14930 [candidate division WOR-3 bacterium]|nr:hypothetical protein [candidate division WOR-3 bacterium]